MCFISSVPGVLVRAGGGVCGPLSAVRSRAMCAREWCKLTPACAARNSMTPRGSLRVASGYACVELQCLKASASKPCTSMRGGAGRRGAGRRGAAWAAWGGVGGPPPLGAARGGATDESAVAGWGAGVAGWGERRAPVAGRRLRRRTLRAGHHVTKLFSSRLLDGLDDRSVGRMNTLVGKIRWHCAGSGAGLKHDEPF